MGNWYARTNSAAIAIWNYYGGSNFNNNSITTTTGGVVAPDSNDNPVISDIAPFALTGSNTISGNMFTDPCLASGTLTLAAEDTERLFWQTKLSNNHITLGDQH